MDCIVCFDIRTVPDVDYDLNKQKANKCKVQLASYYMLVSTTCTRTRTYIHTKTSSTENIFEMC